MLKLADLKAYFTQVLPLATGIYTGLCYVCPNDSRRKRAHGILFSDPIIPAEYRGPNFDEAALMQYLLSNEGYRVQPKWSRRGDSIETLTLSPSIAFNCCHITVSNGEVTP